MPTLKQLIDDMNAFDVRAFPQKNDTRKVTVSIADSAGHRFFLNRVKLGKLPDGTTKWGWARGKQFTQVAQ